jgi:hypothetical protein
MTMQLRIAFCGIFFMNKMYFNRFYKMPVIPAAENFLFNKVIVLDKMV